MRPTLILATAAVFLLAGLTPAIMAEPQGKPDKDKKELKEERHEPKKVKFFEGNTTLSLSGSGVGRDNATYTFTLDAQGKGASHVKDRDGDFRAFKGVMLANATVKDANGTVVKQGEIRIKVFAFKTDDGWRWQVLSFAERDSGMPKLMLRGQAEKVGPGEFNLTGKGHAVVKLDGAEKATPIKLRDVVGVFTREVPK